MGAGRLCKIVRGDDFARIIVVGESSAGDSEPTQVQICSYSSAKNRSQANRLSFQRGLFVLLGAAVLACFAAHLVLPSATEPTLRHR